MKNFFAILVVLTPILLAIGGASIVACSVLQGVTQMESMSEADYVSWSSASAKTVAAFARAAVEEGDISRDTVASLALGARGLADGSYQGSLADLALAADLKGYKGLALMLAMQELSGQMYKMGAYVDGALTERGKSALLQLADEMEKVAAGE